MITLLAALLLSANPAAAPAAKAPAKSFDGPVAVMPFKNLNTDTKLDWLKLGIAETMVSDLKKSGKVAVVERDQVDRALAEIAKQQTAGSEESTAARVGKLVGAKTIVIGSYQQSDKQIRINARFVAVETGVVLDTAKATGPSTSVFALQDEIVDRLLGEPAGTRTAARPKKKTPPAKTYDAYRLYAMSLATATDADRAGMLKASIQIDPELTYAIDDLAALEKRMAALQKVSDVKFLQNEKELLDKALDEKAAGDDRVKAGKVLLDTVHANRRYHALVAIGDRLSSVKLPPFMGCDLGEYASFYRVMGTYRLNQWDLSLQYGEKHLQQYPGSLTYAGASNLMKSMIEKRKTWATRKAEYDADLKENRDGILAGAATPPPEKAAAYDYAPCIVARWNSQENDLMLNGCSAFLDKYGARKDADEDLKKQVEAARCNVIFALASQGNWEKAKPMAEKVMADSDECDDELEGRMLLWPAD